MKLDNIGEGHCPVCAGRLALHDDHGRCPSGHGCYSATTDEVTVILHLNDPTASLRVYDGTTANGDPRPSNG